MWECLLYSIICGLEVTATEAAQGGSLTDEGRQSRHEGWAQIQTGRSASLPTTACLWDGDIIALSLSFANCKMRTLTVVTSQ